MKLLNILMIIALIGCEKKKEDNLLVVGVSADYPPFESIKDGKIVGFDIDIAQEIASSLGLKLEVKDMAFASIFASLQSGSVDVGLSSISASPERAKNFDFSDAYFYDKMVLLVPKTSDIKSPKDIKGKRILAQMGSIGADWLETQKDKIAEAILVDNMVTSVQSLQKGRVDGVILDTVSANAFMKEQGCSNMKIVVLEDGGGCVVALKKGSALTSKVNAVLQKMKKNGKLDALKKKWIGDV